MNMEMNYDELHSFLRMFLTHRTTTRTRARAIVFRTHKKSGKYALRTLYAHRKSDELNYLKGEDKELAKHYAHACEASMVYLKSQYVCISEVSQPVHANESDESDDLKEAVCHLCGTVRTRTRRICENEEFFESILRGKRMGFRTR